MRTSEKGLEIIKTHEGYSESAYLCPAGYVTWGYGSRYYKGMPVTLGMKFSRQEAEEQLRLDVEKFENTILKYVKASLYQEQFDALVSFIYNVGEGAFRKSLLLKKLNENDYLGAADEFLRWDKAGGKALPGLTKRRNSERELFLAGIDKHKEYMDYLAQVKPRGIDSKETT